MASALKEKEDESVLVHQVDQLTVSDSGSEQYRHNVRVSDSRDKAAEVLSKNNMKEVMTFLNDNEVAEGWKELITNNADICKCLLDGVKELDNKNLEPFLPERKKILNALSFCHPEEIKLVILGEDPIPSRRLATGLAFSFPPGTELPGFKGKAVKELHEVLEAVGIEMDGYCLEQWAKNGVLLLNVVLTVDKNKSKHYKTPADYWKVRNAHEAAWIEFTKKLLLKLCLARSIEDLPNIFCWGSNAAQIADFLHVSLYRIFVSDHPTYPQEPDDNNYQTEARKQFTAVNQRYPKLLNTDTNTGQ